MNVPHQRGLFGGSKPGFDPDFTGLRRIRLDGESWVDHAEGWVSGADALFATLVREREWAQRTRRLWDRDMLEPRLTSYWSAMSGDVLEPPILRAMLASLSARYRVPFDSVGFNLYRDGRDSVAWHGDKIRGDIAEPVVALVSLGAARRFLLRPRGGGTSIPFLLGGGDLLVTGGRTQRTWEHSVPKVARAEPRLSLAFRHGLAPDAYRTDKSSR